MDEANVEYCRSFLDVVSRMYRRRLYGLCDWSSTLERVETAENHIEHYLHLLEPEGMDALGLAVEDASAEDPGSYFAAMSLACRMKHFEVVRDILVALEKACGDASTDVRAAASLRYAVATALVLYLPLARAELVMEMLPEATPHVLPVLATWIGAVGGEQATGELQEAVGRPCADPAAVLRALGHMPGPAPRVVLEAVDSPDPRVAQTAAVATLRCGDESMLERLTSIPHAPWAVLPLAMAGGPDVGQWLVEATEREEPSQALLALGLHGDARWLDVLLEHLQVEGHANAAAIGLYVLTGTRLGSSLADPTVLDGPTEIGSDRAWAEGSEISTNRATWARWLERNHRFLRPGRRTRRASLTTPAMDVQGLWSTSPLWLRRCIADEIAIRYGQQWSYEPDLRIGRQRRLFEERWASIHEDLSLYAIGGWQFQGQRWRSEGSMGDGRDRR